MVHHRSALPDLSRDHGAVFYPAGGSVRGDYRQETSRYPGYRFRRIQTGYMALVFKKYPAGGRFPSGPEYPWSIFNRSITRKSPFRGSCRRNPGNYRPITPLVSSNSPFFLIFSNIERSCPRISTDIAEKIPDCTGSFSKIEHRYQSLHLKNSTETHGGQYAR